MAAYPSVPIVFISYSHDDSDHKRWVLDLAGKLRANGVDVLLDAWDLRPGDPIEKFMERGVRDSDRVLMICTEAYVAKANDGVGGVGYEAMIVTGELVRNLGSSKFIPVIRQAVGEPEVPTSVSTRVYINLSDYADVDAEMGKLLLELHHIPPAKPPLGIYRPLAAPSPSVPAVASAASSLPVAAMVPADLYQSPGAVYASALGFAGTDNLLAWRKLIRGARTAMIPSLKDWRARYENTMPAPVAELVEQTMEGANAFAPLAAIALAGVASNNPSFQNQIGLLEDVLNPTEWQRAGYVARIELPETGAFLYQALHGALCLQVGNLKAALRLAREEIPDRKTAGHLALWRRRDIVAWPQALGRNARAAWDTTLNLASRWPWVAEVFGDATEYQAALYAYYVALNALEYVETLKMGHSPLIPGPKDFGPDIPPVFEFVDDEIKRRGYRLAVAAGPSFREFWTAMKVSEGLILEHWDSWITAQRYLIHAFAPFSRDWVSFERLIPDVLRN